jgi:hypothetical protein
MSELPEKSEPEMSDDKAYSIVHLRRAEIEDPAVRASWQARGYATLGPVEGHDPHVRCPICSTDEPPEDCALCGQGPCAFTGKARRAADEQP